MAPSFVHLRLHSEYSLVDGIVRIKPLIKHCVANNMPAVAITDQNNLFGLIKFYRACLGARVKPIIGTDILIKDSSSDENIYRATLLSQNNQGYANVTSIISKAYQQGQQQGVPIVNREWLVKYASGIIVLSGGFMGDVGKALLSNNQELVAKRLTFWKAHFPDNFYLEISRTGRESEEEYLHLAVDLAHQQQLPLVATNDVRFIAESDFDAHEARVCINQGRVLADPRRPKDYSPQQYLRTNEEMLALFEDIPSALENTVEIAKRCNVSLRLDEYFLPDFPIPEGMTIESYFCKVSREGLEERLSVLLNPEDGNYSTKKQEYIDRLEVELDVINQMGFPGYFLIVADFIQWSKNNAIPVGPGRGSGAGSLVAYALKITDLDPLEFDLLFERFLNPERVSMPDFDIDFCMDGRDNVIDYVARKYGRDSVSQIITFGTMAAKAVVRDVGRVLSKPYGFCDRLAKLIPFEIGMTLEKAFEQEEALREWYDSDEEVKEVWDLARVLEGVARNAGKHAGGVVIAPSKLTDFTPLFCDESGGSLVSQFDKDDVEAVGLVKFDFLGLRTLTIIDWALKTINDTRLREQKNPIEIERIPMDDKATFTLLKKAETTAVFQLESRGMKELIKRLQPSCFEDIIALVALFRPGPLGSGMVDDFINRKHGREAVKYPHPNLENILKPTYGTILYQEQVMQIAQVLAGFSLGAADLLRRAMGKKKAEVMEQQGKLFVEGASAAGVDPKLAKEIFDLMAEFAKYGFNKSHSAAYALVSYQTAWLKTHFPAAFMSAVLSADMDNTDKVVTLIEECHSMQLTVIPPDVNVGQHRFTIDDNQNIVYGIGAIKGVGEAAIQGIIQEREANGTYKDLFDFCQRVDSRKTNKRVIESLIKAGALDNLGPSRAIMMASLPEAMKAAEQLSRDRAHGQQDLFGVFDENTMGASPVTWVPSEEWPDDYKLQSEKDTLGLYLTGHPIDQYIEELSRFIPKRIAQCVPTRRDQSTRIAGLVVNVKHIKTRRGGKMAVLTLDDRSGRIEATVFGELYEESFALMQKDAVLVIEGDISPDDFNQGLRASAKQIFPIEVARERFAKHITIRLLSENLKPGYCDELRQILEPYRSGSCPVFIHYKNHQAEANIKLGDEWRIIPHHECLNRLKHLKGIDAVTVDY